MVSYSELDQAIDRSSLAKLVEETLEHLSILSLTDKANPVQTRNLMTEWYLVQGLLRSNYTRLI